MAPRPGRQPQQAHPHGEKEAPYAARIFYLSGCCVLCFTFPFLGSAPVSALRKLRVLPFVGCLLAGFYTNAPWYCLDPPCRSSASPSHSGQNTDRPLLLIYWRNTLIDKFFERGSIHEKSQRQDSWGDCGGGVCFCSADCLLGLSLLYLPAGRTRVPAGRVTGSPRSLSPPC